jgi:hypothetical protein
MVRINDGKMNDLKGKETNQSKVTDCKRRREGRDRKVSNVI